MDKRQFLAASGLGAMALAPLAQASHHKQPGRGPTLLTVTGAISRANRGPFDPALDQMMYKQQLRFDKAHAFDFEALVSLPAIRIEPTLEYDGKPHALRGPLLTDVLRAAGAVLADQAHVTMRAIDGYAPTITVQALRRWRFIVATHLDDRPMALGGLGPLWAIFDADRFADIVALPVTQRFAQCPWGLYHIEV